MTRSRIRTAGVAAAVATSLIVAPNAFADDSATSTDTNETNNTDTCLLYTSDAADE